MNPRSHSLSTMLFPLCYIICSRKHLRHMLFCRSKKLVLFRVMFMVCTTSSMNTRPQFAIISSFWMNCLWMGPKYLSTGAPAQPLCGMKPEQCCTTHLIIKFTASENTQKMLLSTLYLMAHQLGTDDFKSRGGCFAVRQRESKQSPGQGLCPKAQHATPQSISLVGARQASLLPLTHQS